MKRYHRSNILWHHKTSLKHQLSFQLPRKSKKINKHKRTKTDSNTKLYMFNTFLNAFSNAATISKIEVPFPVLKLYTSQLVVGYLMKINIDKVYFPFTQVIYDNV